ncbi:peptidase P60 [Oceanisphaera profunda]|uniref:Peptidase P60 n=1 Tax=Oceanisphaera profunda TaxID=1416627 RepID=A0A1Y0D2X9_9GAMM|nr:NlpC/P60 family protein [Oceanisphaera profunda]ART81882.1 peptidase P60 [Oceanisphaera profunda]
MKKVIILCGLLLIAGCSSSPKQESGKKLVAKKPTSSLTYSISTVPMKRKQTLSSMRNLTQAYQRWRGTPYRFGGVDDQGIDCSAFTRNMYQEAYGMELPRSTYEQVELGYEISKQELEPGDIVFFRTGRTQHNGVYVGDGKFAHASSSVGVTISRLDNVYWRSRYWQARRLLGSE